MSGEVVYVPLPKSNKSEDVKFVNLTPHTISICTGSSMTINIESHGSVRLNEIGNKVGEVNGIPLLEIEYSDPIVDLKVNENELRNAVVIVSGLVTPEAAQKLKEKYCAKLVVAPYTGVIPEYAPVRENGRVKCVRAFRLLA